MLLQTAARFKSTKNWNMTKIWLKFSEESSHCDKGQTWHHISESCPVTLFTVSTEPMMASTVSDPGAIWKKKRNISQNQLPKNLDSYKLNCKFLTSN